MNFDPNAIPDANDADFSSVAVPGADDKPVPTATAAVTAHEEWGAVDATDPAPERDMWYKATVGDYTDRWYQVFGDTNEVTGKTTYKARISLPIIVEMPIPGEDTIHFESTFSVFGIRVIQSDKPEERRPAQHGNPKWEGLRRALAAGMPNGLFIPKNMGGVVIDVQGYLSKRGEAVFNVARPHIADAPF